MALKIDITKAFDTISWDFLAKVLQCMNFSPRFIQLINGILRSAKLSILIYGMPYGYISCSRGVRQGDPLSPLLFCIAEEALIRWLDFYIDSGRISIHRKLPYHLLYADDIMLFMEATRSNTRNITALLQQYGQLSGQVYNPAKSNIFYSPKVPTHIINCINTFTLIAMGSLPFTYLGVPIFIGAPKVEHLSPVVDSIMSIFDRWRGHSLSLAGHHCLINSVIAGSLVHTMMIYRWPKSLLHRLKVAIRCYLWTGDTTKKGFSNVN